jgi:anti-anti-sigma factor
VENAVYYKERDNVIYVKAYGHVNANLCTGLRTRVFDRFESGEPLSMIYVDLSECDYMDSTFMGLLVGFNKRLMKTGGLKLTIVRPTDECKNLLSLLGILNLATVSELPVELPPNMLDVSKEDSAPAEMLLNAHENLMEISEENRKKFELLHNILSQQVNEDSEGK